MEASIIAALISCGAAVMVCLINNYYQQKTFLAKNEAQMDDMIAHNEESIAMIQQTVDNLRVEVEKHNQIVERVYKLEGRADNFCTITKRTSEDISELKTSVNRLSDKIMK